jgi:4'-phosphopantetheinyl transferase
VAEGAPRLKEGAVIAASWPPAPVPWALRPDEVHVWSAPLEQPPEQVEGLLRVLSADERERAGRYRVPRTRAEFVTARGLVRVLLAGYLGRAPEALTFATGPQGKPALAGGGLHFNVSHTHGLALFAFTELGEVGVDVEEVRPRVTYLDLAERFFAPGESALLRGLPPEVSLQAFFNAWTRKEAFLKATGLGLSFGSERVEVTLLPDDEPRILSVGGGPAGRWSLTALAPAPGYVGALAIERPDARVRCWAWPGG